MKFRFSENLVIDSDAEPFCREGLRIANFGGPGSGKSFNNALMVEQFLLQGGTVVIFQPRDEYFTLKEKFDILSVGGVHAKDVDFALTAPLTYAKAVVENGISMIFYTSDVEDEGKLVDWVARFLHAIMKLQETHHRPLMILPEESQEYLPNSTAGHIAPPWVYNRMIKAFKDCSTQGRKLNIISVISSQRPQEVNFTIRQLANVTFYGKFAAHDTKYLDKEVLDTVRKNGVDIRAEQLTRFGKGEWFVVLGSQSQFVTVTEKRLTKHGADTPSLEYIAPRAGEVKRTVDELAKSIMAALEKERAEESDLEKTKRLLRETQKKLEDAEKSAQIKLSVKEMLEPSSVHAPVNASVDKAEFEELEKKIELLESDKAHLKKLAKDAMQSEAETHNSMCQKQNEFDEKFERYENFANALKAILPGNDEKVSAILEVEASKLIEQFKKIAEDAAKRELVKFAAQDGAAAVIELTETLPNVVLKLDRPTVLIDEKSYEGRLIALAYHSGYFDVKKGVSVIAKEMSDVYAVAVNLGQLRDALEKLVQKRFLQRKDNGHGSFEYWLFEEKDKDGKVIRTAKDRIKEVS